VIFSGRTAVVHLHIDEVGVDAVDSRTESFEEHGKSVAASVAEKQLSVISFQWSVVIAKTLG